MIDLSNNLSESDLTAKIDRMWGDYHVREAAGYLQRIAGDGPYHTFFGS